MEWTFKYNYKCQQIEIVHKAKEKPLYKYEATGKVFKLLMADISKRKFSVENCSHDTIH